MEGAIGPRLAARKRPKRPSLRGPQFAILIAAVFAGSLAAAGLALDGSAPPPPPAPSAGQLQLDYRADDPFAYEYRDVVVGDVDGIPGEDIVRVGANGTTPNANITVSAFSESSGFVNKSGSELASAYFTRVELGQLESDPAPEILVSGSGMNYTSGKFEPAVFVYEAASPVALRANGTTALQGFGAETADYFGISSGDVDGDSVAEFVAAGAVSYPPFAAYDRRALVYIGHLAGNSLVMENYHEMTGSWVEYHAVRVAELGGPAGPEIVFAGARENRSYLGVARVESGSLVFKANASFGSGQFGQVEAVDVGNILAGPEVEIAACGWQYQLSAAEALVTVWQWDGGSGLSQQRQRNWTGALNSAACYDVENVDTAGGPEPEYVSTVGYNYNDTANGQMLGELMLMSPDLVEVDKLQWTGSDTDHWGMSSADLDGDGKVEIVSVGMKNTGATILGETQVVEVPEVAVAAVPAPVAASLALLAAGRRRRRPRPSATARAPRAL
jgi:hypothetical protein